MEAAWEAEASGFTHTMALHAVLPLHGGLGRALLQQQGRADQGQGDGDGEDGGHRHQTVAPQVGDRLPRDVAGRDGHQVRAAKLSGSSSAGACSAMAPVGEPAPAAAVALSMP